MSRKVAFIVPPGNVSLKERLRPFNRKPLLKRVGVGVGWWVGVEVVTCPKFHDNGGGGGYLHIESGPHCS